jgi:hypothetical protein
MCALIGLVGSAVAYVRTVRTGSGAVAVQIVWSSRRGSRRIEHLGSAHDESKVEPGLAAFDPRLPPELVRRSQLARAWHQFACAPDNFINEALTTA